jgi:hypothetical protein
MKLTLLTAEKAEKIADNNEELDDLLDRIFEKAFIGKYCLYLSEKISDEIVTELKELGYKVEFIGESNPICTIRWSFL